jgi:hypothetical protein
LNNEKERWEPFDDIENAIIETAFIRKENRVELDNYIIYLKHFIQMSKQDTGNQRPVKRAPFCDDNLTEKCHSRQRFCTEAEPPVKSICGFHWHSSRYIHEWTFQFKPESVQNAVCDIAAFYRRGYHRGFQNIDSQIQFARQIIDNPRVEYEPCNEEWISWKLIAMGLPPSTTNQRFHFRESDSEESDDCRPASSDFTSKRLPRPCQACKDHFHSFSQASYLKPAPIDKLQLIEKPANHFYLQLSNEIHLKPLSSENDAVPHEKGQPDAYRYFHFTSLHNPYRKNERCFLKNKAFDVNHSSTYGDLWTSINKNNIISPSTSEDFSSAGNDFDVYRSSKPFLRLELNDSSYPSCSNILWVAYQNEGDPNEYSKLIECGLQLSCETQTPLVCVREPYPEVLRRMGGRSHGYRIYEPWRIADEQRLIWLTHVVELACSGLLEEGRAMGQPVKAQFLVEHLKMALEYDQLWSQCSYLYTCDSFLYQSINRALRQHDIGKIYTLGPFCYLLHWSLCSLSSSMTPSFTGTVYRGINLTDQLIQTYKDACGTYASWFGFSSASKNRAVADVLGNTLFVIHIQNGQGLCQDVSSVSNFTEEEEVLIRAGVVFQIVSVEIDSISQKYVIHLLISNNRTLVTPNVQARTYCNKLPYNKYNNKLASAIGLEHKFCKYFSFSNKFIL